MSRPNPHLETPDCMNMKDRIAVGAGFQARPYILEEGVSHVGVGAGPDTGFHPHPGCGFKQKQILHYSRKINILIHPAGTHQKHFFIINRVNLEVLHKNASLFSVFAPM